MLKTTLGLMFGGLIANERDAANYVSARSPGLRMWTAAQGVLAVSLLATVTAARGPSFTEVPVGQSIVTSGLSPSGQFICGANTDISIPFRWNRATGQYLEMGGLWVGNGVEVLDNGRVFGNRRLYNENLQRVFCWIPETGVIGAAARLSDPSRDIYVDKVSRDGQYAIGRASGANGDPLNPALFDFTSGNGSGIATDLSVAPGIVRSTGGAMAGVSLPVNGARFAYGTGWFDGNSDARGVIWTLPFQQPTISESWDTLVDISPRSEVILGTAGGQYIIRGDGPDRALLAPTTPAMQAPEAIAISDDGQVAVGKAWSPLLANGERDAVVWRKGQPPARLKDILAAVGINMPVYESAELVGVSADGSIVAGTYTTDVFASIGGNAFVAVLPALNDNCGTARAVTYGTVFASTIGATRAGVSGTCAAEGSAPDIWFSFVPLANEVISIDTCGSTFDTTLNIFQASSCGSIGAALACNDDASPACSDNVHASRITTSVFAGTNYYIRVSGWNGAAGSVQLTITAPNRPSNDACAQAIDVPSGTGAFFSNLNALSDSRPGCAGTPFNDVWFKTVAPESGRMTFSTCSANFNAVMIVYDGSACGDMNAAPLVCGSNNTACGSGVGNKITVSCTAGQTLLVRVGGLFGGSGSGTFLARFACDVNPYSPYSTAVLAANPRAYWRFEDSGSRTAADAVRSDPYSCGNYPGEYVGQVSRSLNFQGKALTLEHSGGYVRAQDATHVSDLAICPTGATLEAWVKTRDPFAGVIMTNRNAPGDTSLTLVVGYNPLGYTGTEGKVMFVTDGPGQFHGAISGVRVDDGRWHHVIGKRRFSGIPGLYFYDIFIDGAYSGSSNLSGVGTAHSGVNGSYWLIGNGTAWPAANAVFHGRIDEVAIYCGLLSDPVMREHYEIGRPCTADYNFDRSIDIFDYLDFVNAFANNSPDADVKSTTPSKLTTRLMRMSISMGW